MDDLSSLLNHIGTKTIFKKNVFFLYLTPERRYAHVVHAYKINMTLRGGNSILRDVFFSVKLIIPVFFIL